MLNLSVSLSVLIWVLAEFIKTFPVSSNPLNSVNGNWTFGVGNLYIPGVNEAGGPYYLMEEEPRGKRDSDLDDLGMEAASFEVPSILRVNETKNSEPQVSLLSSEPRSANGLDPGMGMNNCSPSKKPIQISLMIENVLPAGKSDRYSISNSSEIRGTGLLFRMQISELKSTACPNSDLVFNFDVNNLDKKLDKIETKFRKNTMSEGTVKTEEDEDEEEEGSDPRMIQEMLKKILSAGSINSSTQVPVEEISNLLRSSGEPLTLVVKPSVLQKLTPRPRLGPATSHRSMVVSKSPNSAEYDHLCKLVEHLSSNLPKTKLMSLLSSLVGKVPTSEGHSK